MGSMTLDTEAVTTLKGVGPAVAEKLSTLGIETVQDVLFHLPYRYQDRTHLSSLLRAFPGQEGIFEVEVERAEVVMRRRRSLLVYVRDEQGHGLTLRFFHFGQTQARAFQAGVRMQVFGELRRGPSSLEIVHPEYRLASQGVLLQDRLTPFYPTTDGVAQTAMRKLGDQALDRLDAVGLEELLGVDCMPRGLALPSLHEALHCAHRPPPRADVAALLEGRHPAHRRLAFEELVAQRLALRTMRARSLDQQGIVMRSQGHLRARLLENLPFKLTGAQSRVVSEVLDDIATGKPMLRLVQGDVGAGKTIVAALAAVEAVECGWQVAIMAPTEILAEQHLLNFNAWLEPLGLDVGWLSGRVKAAGRRATLEGVAMGRYQVVVGTHALFQQDVEFQKLGLLVIDEQHRFGVHQRLALRNKGIGMPHQLTMTATPIPRTLAMTAYADLDISVIDELPPGRQPVKTAAMDNGRRDELISRVDAALAEGRQVYWVCTLIEESDTLQAQTAEDTAKKLSEQLPRHRIGLVHGRMKGKDKEAVMQAFKAHELDLLVATTVIEVGVDVPNASLMIIENAERLGLSQLHQLRGRVGRGAAQSSCLLLFQGPLSVTARKRLDILRKSNDGFVIAEKDLELRGAGEVLGTRQTGIAALRVADLARDADLMDEVVRVADGLAVSDPTRVERLIRRWVGEVRQEYAGV